MIASPSPPIADIHIDLSGLHCPLPILRAKKALADVPSGTVLQISCTDPAAPADFTAFCAQTGHQLLHYQQTAQQHLFWIAKR